jgi:hypothetical protein
MTSIIRGIHSSDQDIPNVLPIPSIPIAGEDAQAAETHQLIKELGEKKAKQSADFSLPSLKGRITPPTTPPRTPPKQSKWLDLHSSDESTDDSSESSDVDEDSPGKLVAFSSSSYCSLRNSLDSSFFITPPPSPKRAMLKTTPDAVKDLEKVIANNDPGSDLTPTSDRKMKTALKKIDELESPYRSQQKLGVRARFGEALTKTGSTSEVHFPATARRLVFSSTNCEDVSGRWAIILAKSLEVHILDANHLKNLEKQGGFHICGEGHLLDTFVKFRRTNLLTGVWSGRVFDSKNPRIVVKEFSSFIPRKMTLEKYESLIAEAINKDTCKLAQQGNRRLYMLTDEDHNFVIECYFQEEGTRIRSAIPVFHYEIYDRANDSFKVEYSSKWSLDEKDPLVNHVFEVKYAQLFELLEKDPTAIVYKMDKKIVVDVGMLYENNPKYGSCPIERGILVEISKEFLV